MTDIKCMQIHRIFFCVCRGFSFKQCQNWFSFFLSLVDCIAMLQDSSFATSFSFFLHFILKSHFFVVGTMDARYLFAWMSICCIWDCSFSFSFPFSLVAAKFYLYMNARSYFLLFCLHRNILYMNIHIFFLHFFCWIWMHKNNGHNKNGNYKNCPQTKAESEKHRWRLNFRETTHP